MKFDRLYLLLSLIFILCITACENDNYSKIVFIRGEPGSIWGDLYTIDYTGKNLFQLTHSGQDAYPRWSPKKDKIVFNRRVGGAKGNWDIYMINPDGTGETALIKGEKDDIYPAWSPDGERLVFVRLHNSVPDGNAFIVYNINQNAEEIFDDYAILGKHLNLFDPCWSPDGDKIAFYGSGGDYTGIYTVSYPDGTPCAYIKAGGKQPDWTRETHGKDKSKLVFLLNGIRVMNEYGANVRLVIEYGENPRWSVKFNEIVFQKLNTSGPAPYTNQIYRIQEDGTTLIQLTNDSLKEHKYPHW
jgi:Tol biopolymer transport system component